MSNNYPYSTDLELWQAFKSGSKEAYSFMYRKFAPVLYNYGCKICGDKSLVEDSIQDLFIHILTNKQALSDTTNIKFYLFKSLRREIITKLTTHQKHFSSAYSLLPFDSSPACALPSHETLLISAQQTEEQTQILTKELSSLPARQKEAIFLKFYDNLSYDEIASIMEIDHKSVYKTIYKAIDVLQKKIAFETLVTLLLTNIFQLLVFPFLK